MQRLKDKANLSKARRVCGRVLADFVSYPGFRGHEDKWRKEQCGVYVLLLRASSFLVKLMSDISPFPASP